MENIVKTDEGYEDIGFVPFNRWFGSSPDGVRYDANGEVSSVLEVKTANFDRTLNDYWDAEQMRYVLVLLWINYIYLSGQKTAFWLK